MTLTNGIPSISYDQHEIIKWIIELHLGGQPIQCDPTWGHGEFYKDGIEKPEFVYDLNGERGVKKADARHLPHKDASLSSIMFDPPFLHQTGEGSIIKERFGDYKTIPLLWKMYSDAIKEFARVLQPNGMLIFKCQDTVSSAMNYFSHVQVMNLAVAAGFYPKDLFILLAKNRIPQWNQKKQQHARKFHSYFWVFEKRPSRVAYT